MGYDCWSCPFKSTGAFKSAYCDIYKTKIYDGSKMTIVLATEVVQCTEHERIFEELRIESKDW